MKITGTLKSDPIEERCFNITFENGPLKTNVCIWNPLNLYQTEYSDDKIDTKKEWNNMHDAILNNREYRLDINQNGTNLMIDCYNNKVLLSSIPYNSHYNMIDVFLSLDEYKDELLKVIQSLLDVLDLFPERQDSDFICKDFNMNQ